MGLYDSPSPGGKRGGTYDSSGKSKKKKHHGLLGALEDAGDFVENLGRDVKDAAVGIPMGIKQLATHPGRAGKAIAKTTWHDWSPLIHGHAGEWAHNFKEHPLNPILDVATIASLGLGGVARGAGALSKAGVIGDAGKISRASKIAKEGRIRVADPAGSGRTLERTLSRSRGAAFRQALAHEVSGRANPWFSDTKYFERLDFQDKMTAMAGADYAMQHLVKAGKKIGTPTGLSSILKTIHENAARAARPLEGTTDVPRGFHTVLDPSKVGTQGTSALSLYRKGTSVKSPTHIENLLTEAHKRFIDPPSGLELRDAKGNLMIVRKGAVEGYSKEAGNSAKSLRMLVTAPTTVWKYAVLGLRPGFFTNNAVGNITMATVGYGPVAVNSWAKALGRPVARKFRGMDEPAWLVHFPEQKAAHMAGTFGKNKFERSKVGRAARGVAPLTGYVAEQKIREGLLEVELKRSPVVREIKKKKGVTWHQAMNEALEKDHELATHISKRIDNTMGNYHAYHQWEKGVRALVPFYGWQRAITRHTKNLAADRPITFNLMAKQGQEGADETARILGDIPDFMRGVIPLEGGKLDEEGRTGILGTQGFNPYASDAELVGALGGLSGLGDQTDAKFDLASLIGPIPVGAMEQLTGSKASGSPAQFTDHGLIAGMAESIGYNLPETQLLLAAMNKLPPSEGIDKRTGLRTRKLYKKDWDAVFRSYLGAPVKRYSPQAGKKLKKRKKKKVYRG